jgi:hypothetical protein
LAAFIPKVARIFIAQNASLFRTLPNGYWSIVFQILKISKVLSLEASSIRTISKLDSFVQQASDEVNNIFFFILAQTITDIESVLAVVFLGLAKANFPKTPK